MYSNGDPDISWEDKSKFVTGVDQFLELYNGQRLLTHRICFCLGNEYGGYVDRWIRFAIIMKAEKLDLDFSARPESQSNNLYDFPAAFFLKGNHPDDGQPVVLKLEKFGFSIRHRHTIAPVPEPNDITFEKALELLLGKDVKRCGRAKSKLKLEGVVEEI
ncbi:hypothetical protein LOK49_LG12G02867 [Camellia lanceoleosa]|uniref:Uncharacterized protein n=1 Tax=Camellia lanceoleosa TaxID=1840588 RepID=A0ACC0FN41_9ERIC|nr:hypothetical protein LOK49_LG12G02867 [Camellia lanceoleosa]